MTREEFFAKFEVFAGLPRSAEKTRNLILRLAVQGRLLSQNESDEPAQVAVSRLPALPPPPRFDKRSRARIEGIGAMSVGPTVRHVPIGWSCVPLIQIAKLESGHTPSRTRRDWWDGDIPWVGLVDARRHDGRAIHDTLQHTNEAGLANSAARLLPAGTVCISRTASVGYVVVLARPMSTSQDFVNWVPTSVVTSDWLRLVFTAEKDGFARFSKGAVHQTIYYPEWLSMHVMLPPFAEQKRIVAKVDELMTLCDRLEAQQKDRETRHAALARASLSRFAAAPTPANLTFLFHKSYTIPSADLRKSILTLAIRGKLVQQDPHDEPATELLKRIDTKRLALLKAAYPNPGEASTQMRKQLTQSLPAGLPPLPQSWSWATLIQASLLVVDCHNKTAPYAEKGIRLLRTTNIRDGRLNLTEPKFVDHLTYERWSARCKPEPGDVLVTREAPMGEACIIPDGMSVCLGQRMMLIRVVPGTMDTKYLLYSLMSPDLMTRVQDKPVGATVQHLRVGGVETLLTPIPPLAEQRRIVAKVDHLMDLVDSLETQLVASRATAAKLLDAFVSELTA